MIYLDTSWLVKLYVEESDSERVRAQVHAEPIVASELAYAEVHAAAWRRHGEGRLPRQVVRRTLARFAQDWPTLHRVPVVTAVLDRTPRLIEHHGLRALDSIQLASALLVADGATAAVGFGAADPRLRRAAAAEGLMVLEA